MALKKATKATKKKKTTTAAAAVRPLLGTPIRSFDNAEEDLDRLRVTFDDLNGVGVGQRCIVNGTEMSCVATRTVNGTGYAWFDPVTS